MTITEATTVAVAVIPAVSMVASALSAVIPDARLGAFAKFLNLLALNVGRARNDPAVNGKDLQDEPAPTQGRDLQGEP